MTIGKINWKKKHVLLGKTMLSRGKWMTSYREFSIPIMYRTAPDPCTIILSAIEA